jgi:DNA modification methylase
MRYPDDFINKIIQGDCLEVLREIPDCSVQMCVTSPPYYGLRDYGVEGQIGLEETSEIYVQKLVEIFREVKRALKDDGTLWLNLGDTYWSKGESRHVGYGDPKNPKVGIKKFIEPQAKSHPLFKPKDLIGIPWRVAFALQANSWYLRQDIIWHKPNPMPESVTDRCTKAHEYIFLLAKNQKYYFDNEAIREPLKTPYEQLVKDNRGKNKNVKESSMESKHGGNKTFGETINPNGRNKRSVWTITTKPFKEAHFATFPEDLVIPCIKAGSKEGDIVLDPFIGSGTTGFVAKKFGRSFIGIELNSDYCKIAEKRLAQEVFNFK